MATSTRKARSALITASSHIFRDVVTDEPARTEEEFSALLAVFHNRGQMDWEKVNLTPVEPSGLLPEVSASSLGIRELKAYCEYPLFCAPGSAEMRRHGRFRADILFLGETTGPLIYVEAKIDIGIRPDLILGALQYLDAQDRFRPASFVILRPHEEINPNWYVGDLIEVLKLPELKLKQTKSYIMYWEDLFKSCANG